MPKFKDETIDINGRNYVRDNTVFEISALGMVTTDITKYIRSVNYTDVMDKGFGYTINTKRPTSYASGNFASEGTISFTDNGLIKLDQLAISAGLPSYLFLGESASVTMTVSYVLYNDLVKTDTLNDVHFTTYVNGVNTDDMINTREIPMIIGQVVQGTVLEGIPFL